MPRSATISGHSASGVCAFSRSSSSATVSTGNDDCRATTIASVRFERGLPFATGFFRRRFTCVSRPYAPGDSRCLVAGGTS